MQKEADDEEKLLSIDNFSWDVLNYSKDVMQLAIKFQKPEEIGAYSSKDSITVTFWGVEFF